MSAQQSPRTVAELIADLIGDRTYADLSRQAGSYQLDDGTAKSYVSMAAMKDLADPDRAWRAFSEPPTIIGLSNTLRVTPDRIIDAQRWSIALWYERERPNVGADILRPSTRGRATDLGGVRGFDSVDPVTRALVYGVAQLAVRASQADEAGAPGADVR